MKKIIPFLLFGLIGTFYADAQVTFSEHIAPIIYNNCTSCHRPGEVGPMNFTNYQEVADWASTIQYVTEIRYMPPWKPDRNYSNFVGERGLTEEEIQLIADWVDAGVPQGNSDLEPPLPNFPTGSQLGTPDLVLEMAEDYFIEGNNQDDYRVFVLPTGLTEDKEIAAVEFRPGNGRAVHHVIMGFETKGKAAALDAESEEYGYESFGSFGVPDDGMFVAYTPGIESIKYPQGMGKVLTAGADFLIQVHYAPLPTDETDRSHLNIFFKEPNDPVTRPVQLTRIWPFALDGGWSSFVIPPNEVKPFHGTKTFTEDISLLSIYPHCHYLGKDWEIFAVTPSNDTINIIKIDEWDFNWQGAYVFDRMKKIPANATIHFNATYDNTLNNPYNPSNPLQTVSWGETTTDEMFIVGLNWVPYQAGDEDIIIGEDNITTGIEAVVSNSGMYLYSPFPNPTSDVVTLNYYLDKRQNISIELFDTKGTLVNTVLSQAVHQPGNHKLEFNVGELPDGAYTIRLSTAETALAKTLVVAK